MRNSRLDRILYIQQVLVQGGVLNKQQTADRFGVSEKTIQRDLDTLRSYFADSEPRREILYNSAKGGYLLDDTLSRFLTSSEILYARFCWKAVPWSRRKCSPFWTSWCRCAPRWTG